jgi:hypothetical protein
MPDSFGKRRIEHCHVSAPDLLGDITELLGRKVLTFHETVGTVEVRIVVIQKRR